jgi:hypothetical protein
MAQPPPDDDDDFELELEPVDPEILAAERRRGEQKTEEAVAKVNIDEILEKRGPSDHEIEWSKLRQFRFTTRHLLIATAILAIFLTLQVQLGGCMALFISAMAAIGAGWYAVARVERREAAERERIKREFYASQKKAPAGEATAPGDAVQVAERPPRLGFKFSFSLKQVMITMTVAAVLLTFMKLVTPEGLTIMLGLIALAGLAIQTFGWFDPPPAIVLGWWMLMVLYLALGLLMAFFPNIFGSF